MDPWRAGDGGLAFPLLIPFSQRWFYSDAIFIVDPWILTLLVSRVIWSRRRRQAGVATARAARVALMALVAYIGGMTYISRVTTRVGLLDNGTSYERWRAEWRPWGTRG